jgi:hypothetical protein
VPKVFDGFASEKECNTYAYNVKGIQDYIDSRHDILEHKFLFLVCNVCQMHWISVVVINPFLVSDKYLAAGKDVSTVNGAFEDLAAGKDVSNVNGGLGDDDFAGWCVLDSNGPEDDNGENGFQGTSLTKNKASMRGQ